MEESEDETMQGLTIRSKIDGLPDEALVSTAQCAAYHHVSVQAINAAIKRSAINAEKVGSGYVMRKKDCLSYQPLTDHGDRARRKAEKMKQRSKTPKAGEQEGSA